MKEIKNATKDDTKALVRMRFVTSFRFSSSESFMWADTSVRASVNSVKSDRIMSLLYSTTSICVKRDG